MNFSNIDNGKHIQRKKNIMPSYRLPHTQIAYIKKRLFQLFNPHLEGTLTNLYMNEKKILSLRKGEVSLRINRTSQFAFDSYNFCRAFHGGSSEKKIKILSCVCAEIFTE